MKTAKVNDVVLEYEVIGRGEPILLIPTGPVADSFHPMVSQQALAARYQLIVYHRRGQCGSTHTAPPVSFGDQASDAAGLLEFLNVERAHVAGHSTGGVVALQLALDYPDRVQSLALLEPTLMRVPSAEALMETAAPVFEAYSAGDKEGAMESFISTVCGMPWGECESLLEERVSGSVAQTMRDADTFFAIDLPAHGDWNFGAPEAERLTQPVLSVLGTNSLAMFVEGRELLHALLTNVEDCTIQDVGHFLHIERPGDVASGLAAFFARHPINAVDPEWLQKVAAGVTFSSY